MTNFILTLNHFGRKFYFVFCVYINVIHPSRPLNIPVTRASAVVMCISVASLRGQLSGSSLRAPSPPSVASSSWILWPEMQFSQRPFLYPKASPTAPRTIAALNFSMTPSQMIRLQPWATSKPFKSFQSAALLCWPRGLTSKSQ